MLSPKCQLLLDQVVRESIVGVAAVGRVVHLVIRVFAVNGLAGVRNCFTLASNVSRLGDGLVMLLLQVNTLLERLGHEGMLFLSVFE